MPKTVQIMLKQVLILLAIAPTSLACASQSFNSDVGATTQSEQASRCKAFDSFSGRTNVDNIESVPPTAAEGVVPGYPAFPPLPQLLSASLAHTETSDSVTFALEGTGIVGWSGRFVDEPTCNGTTESIPIAGTCVLQFDLTGVGRNYISEQSGSAPMKIEGGEQISEVVEVLNYAGEDGVVQSFIGIRNDSPGVSIDTISLDDSRINVTVSISN